MRIPYILALALIAFIIGGLAAEKSMASSARSLGLLVGKAEAAAKRGQTKTALDDLRQFERRWSRLEKSWALITDHHEMDQIKIAADRADRFLSSNAPSNARAELASLRFLVEDIPKKESVGINSVF